MTRKRTKPAGGKARPRNNWQKIFLAHLGETSNVTAAAQAAVISLSHVYKLRRTDAGFARGWFDALAEGYDNLEMELLQRLRGGEDEDGAKGTAKGKFDTATALRCLTAHRESVAREKGRRTLAQEVETIAAINAKIDAMRQRQAANRRLVAQARKAKAAARPVDRSDD